MTTTFEQITVEPNRDRWGRPLIIPPSGGKPIPYKRCTSYIDVLEDKYKLQQWKQRMVAVGLALRPDLHVAASSMATHPDDHKTELNDVCKQAAEAAKGSAKATIGTALHTFIERINRGLEPGAVPSQYQQHIENYQAAMAGFTPIYVERFAVNDDLKVGGTPDLIAELAGHEGRFIVDLKTGPSTIKYGALKVAMQMAMYAHSVLYSPVDGAREAIDGLRTDVGVLIALDSETGDCQLRWVDIASGWEAIRVATQVHQWRTRKDLLADFQPLTQPALEEVKPYAARTDIERALFDAIAAAESREALLELWGQAADHWTEQLTNAAKVRLQQVA